MNRIMIFFGSVFVATVLTGVAETAMPADLYVYPAGDQTAEQTQKDRYDCYLWASRESGYDPALDNQPEGDVVRVPIGKNEKQGATLTGTVIGAIAGAAIGSTDRKRHGSNTATGAVVGAAAGTVIGAAIERDGQRTAEAVAREKADAIAEDQSASANSEARYRRAFSACLEGRGYVVR